MCAEVVGVAAEAFEVVEVAEDWGRRWVRGGRGAGFVEGLEVEDRGDFGALWVDFGHVVGQFV